MIGLAIAGWGSAVPRQSVSNEYLSQQFGIDDEWITTRTGVRERRRVSDGEATSTLAVDAAITALGKAGLPAPDVGALIIATATPDQPCPATAAFVQHELGLACGAFDLNAECAGFVYALVTAAMFTHVTREPVLVVGADTHSRYVNPDDRDTAVLLGDGAGAVVVAPSPFGALLSFDLGCDGSGASFLEIPAGGSRRPPTLETVKAKQHYIQMNGPELFREAVRASVRSAAIALDGAGVTADDLDLFIPHQANARIIAAVAKRLGIPEQSVMMNLDRYGNTSSASIPIALAEAADTGRLHDGDLVLLSGFGAGMTWASAVVRWSTT
jgi:3-oxoacyl-[acyl-carrier-protein] synthase III